MLAVRRSSRAHSPTGASKRGLRRGKCPRPRPDRTTSFGIAHAGHPSSHALPSGGGHELRKRAHQRQRRWRAALSRAGVQLGRPRHARLVRGASQPHLQRGPRSGLVQNQQSSLPPRRERLRAPVRACGRGERVGGTARKRVVARGASAHAPLGGGCGRAGGAWAGLPRGPRVGYSHESNHSSGRNSQRTV